MQKKSKKKPDHATANCQAEGAPWCTSQDWDSCLKVSSCPYFPRQLAFALRWLALTQPTSSKHSFTSLLLTPHPSPLLRLFNLSFKVPCYLEGFIRPPQVQVFTPMPTKLTSSQASQWGSSLGSPLPPFASAKLLRTITPSGGGTLRHKTPGELPRLGS